MQAYSIIPQVAGHGMGTVLVHNVWDLVRMFRALGFEGVEVLGWADGHVTILSRGLHLATAVVARIVRAFRWITSVAPAVASAAVILAPLVALFASV